MQEFLIHKSTNFEVWSEWCRSTQCRTQTGYWPSNACLSFCHLLSMPWIPKRWLKLPYNHVGLAAKCFPRWTPSMRHISGLCALWTRISSTFWRRRKRTSRCSSTWTTRRSWLRLRTTSKALTTWMKPTSSDCRLWKSWQAPERTLRTSFCI